MAKRWRLSNVARHTLDGIFDWTLDHFGEAQARRYAADLIDHCNAIAGGRAQLRSAQRMIDPSLPSNVFLSRHQSHFIVFIDRAEEILIIDFLHARQDLPARISSRLNEPD